VTLCTARLARARAALLRHISTRYLALPHARIAHHSPRTCATRAPACAPLTFTCAAALLLQHQAANGMAWKTSGVKS